MSPEDHQRNEQFMRLYLEHELSLRGFIRSLVPTLTDTHDVMQDVAAILWRKFDGLDDTENFRRWAFGVARLEAMQFLRSRGRDRHVFSDEVLDLLAVDAERAAEQTNRELIALEKCLQRLSAAQRKLIESTYQSGAQIKDVAATTGRTAMSLYKELHRIRMSLVDCTRKNLSLEDFA